MASVELTALVVALVALSCSFLQVIQQYVSSATARSKVNRAAIGPMARKNKYRWSMREWKLRIRYARVDSRAMMTALQGPGLSANLEFYDQFPDYRYRLDPDSSGNHIKITVVRHDVFQTPVLPSTFTQKQRGAITRFERQMNERYRRMPPCKASWCNMMTDLGIDPSGFSTKDTEYLDADTVPTALDAPIIYIKMSDVILFGFLLYMEICHFNVKSLVIDMLGNDCNITTQYQGTAGMISRYSGLSPEIKPMALHCSPREISMLLYTASGSLLIGDTVFNMLILGYNVMDYIFSEIIHKARGDHWQQVYIANIKDKAEPDAAFNWSGKWASPLVPVIPFLLAHCGNPSVANAFPHRNLGSWKHQQRQCASVAAFQYIRDTINFTSAPPDLFRRMTEEKLDFVMLNHFRIVNTWDVSMVECAAG